jgi:hypothetical protein
MQIAIAPAIPKMKVYIPVNAFCFNDLAGIKNTISSAKARLKINAVQVVNVRCGET